MDDARDRGTANERKNVLEIARTHACLYLGKACPTVTGMLVAYVGKLYDQERPEDARSWARATAIVICNKLLRGLISGSDQGVLFGSDARNTPKAEKTKGCNHDLGKSLARLEALLTTVQILAGLHLRDGDLKFLKMVLKGASIEDAGKSFAFSPSQSRQLWFDLMLKLAELLVAEGSRDEVCIYADIVRDARTAGITLSKLLEFVRATGCAG